MTYQPTINNRVSTANSTTTPLSAGVAFTGTAEDVSGYNSVVIALKTDQDGTFNVQFSNDGTNWDTSLNRYYRTNQIEAPHRFTITRKYCRIIFTNTSASNQTYFRLQVIFGEKADLNMPLDSVVSQDYDSISVRPTKYEYEVALGRRQGATAWNKFGYNADVDVGTEIVGAQGGTFTFLTSASTLTIVSSSTDDDGSPSGIGANTVTISGIDANRKAQTEVVTLNGTASVVTATTWLGINRASVSLSGSSYSNVGNITITATTGGTTQGYIPAGKGTSQQLIFFTQENHQFLADWIALDAERLAGGGTPPRVQFRGWVWNAATNTKYEIMYALLDLNLESEHSYSSPNPFVIAEKCVFWVEATSDLNNVTVSGRFSGTEFRDVDA